MKSSRSKSKSRTKAAILRHGLDAVLPEKSHFMTQLEETLHIASVSATELAVFLISIDSLVGGKKKTGLLEEQALVAEAAAALKKNLGSGEYLAHLGGPNFGILMFRISGAADALAKQTQLHELFRSMKKTGLTGISVGISLSPRDGSDADTLFSRATVAMKQARLNGGACSQFYGRETHDHLLESMHFEVEMRLGMKRGEFKLVYQPQCSLDDGACNSAEALLRWDHPKDGPISPLRFIAAAEESGLIRHLGQWVVEQACIALAQLEARGLKSFKIAVNLSPKQFSDPRLLGLLRRCLIAHDLDPSCLGIEVTESCAMLDMNYAVDVLKQLQGYGVQVSLDDFGTGYSSLSQLRRFPLDIIKLDKSFIDELALNEDAAIIVSAVVGLAHRLGLRVTAEGVESVQQHELLADMSCDFVQGYLISRPLNFEALLQFISTQKSPTPAMAYQHDDHAFISAIAA